MAHACRSETAGIAASSFFAFALLDAMLCSQEWRAEHTFEVSLALLGRMLAANYALRLMLATFVASGGRDAEGPA